MASFKKILLTGNAEISEHYTGIQLFALTFLRILIGWHFLYEGMIKLFSSPAWTAKYYLQDSIGPFAGVFRAMAANPKLLALIDMMNVWGLILIGLSLFTGLFAKVFKIFGIALLFLYYFAYPPFMGYATNAPAEGSYWIVNKNLIEIASLFVLYLFPSSHLTGIDRFLNSK